jgi:hypothetical protein
MLDLAVRFCVAVVAGATGLGLAVYHRPRRAPAAGGLALALLTASGGTAFATWNPNSVLEPKFSGLLSSAPSLVGNAHSIVTEFDLYQKELARLVTNVIKLYDVTSPLPAYQPDRDLGPLPGPGHASPPGLGRDRTGRSGPDDGRGQPPPAEGEPAGATPSPSLTGSAR